MLQTLTTLFLVVVVFIVLVALARSARVVAQYEKGLVLRLGRYRSTASSGLTFLVPMIEDMIKVLESKLMPDLQRGRYPDKKAAKTIAELMHAVARELEV